MTNLGDLWLYTREEWAKMNPLCSLPGEMVTAQCTYGICTHHLFIYSLFCDAVGCRLCSVER